MIITKIKGISSLLNGGRCSQTRSLRFVFSLVIENIVTKKDMKNKWKKSKLSDLSEIMLGRTPSRNKPFISVCLPV